MYKYGVESIFQIYTSHPAIWLNDFENIWQGFHFKILMLHVYSVVLNLK